MTAVIRRETWDWTTAQVQRLYLLGDTQYGNPATDEPAADKAIERAANDPAARVILMGDIIDAITRSDRKRYREDAFAPWLYGAVDPVGVEIEYALEKLKPIAHKLDAVLTGNHEDKAGQDAHRALVRGLKQHAGLPFTAPLSLDYAGYLRYAYYGAPAKRRENLRTFTAYLFHGAGSGGKHGGAATNRMDEMTAYRDVDLFAMGHTHHLSARPAVRELLDRKDNIQERITWTVNTGSFLRNRKKGLGSTYSERGGYQPIACGYAIVHLEPHHNDGVKARVELVTV